MDPGDELVELTVVSNEMEAEMIRGLLSSADIESMERPTSGGPGIAPGLVPGGASQIFVRRSQLDDAKSLLEADNS